MPTHAVDTARFLLFPSEATRRRKAAGTCSRRLGRLISGGGDCKKNHIALQCTANADNSLAYLRRIAPQPDVGVDWSPESVGKKSLNVSPEEQRRLDQLYRPG